MTRRGLSPHIAATDADPDSSQALPLGRRWKRFAAIGIAAYAAALIAMLPARFAVDWGARWQMAGTVWSGEAVLDNTYRLRWRWAPLRTLATFAFAGDVRLTDSGTDIAGSVIARGRRLRFDGLSGRADGALLSALDPALPFACDAVLEVTLSRLILDRARSSAVGEVRAGSGHCGAVSLPPLLATLRAGPDRTTLGQLAPVGQARLHLVEGSIADGRLVVALTPAGAAALPFARGLRIDEPL